MNDELSHSCTDAKAGKIAAKSPTEGIAQKKSVHITADAFKP
jgi:hypothetical protein